MILDNKTVICFHTIVRQDIFVVYTFNTENNHFCCHYIGNGHNDIKAITYIFTSEESHSKYLFVGYGCQDFDAPAVDYAVMHMDNSCGIYSYMKYSFDKDEKRDLFLNFYHIDLKKILFTEKQQPSYRQMIYALGLNTVSDYADIEELKSNRDINMVYEVLKMCYEKLEMRFSLYYQKKINALLVDDTLLGIRYLTKKYLEISDESYSHFTSGRTQPQSFIVKDLVKCDISLKNSVLSDFLNKAKETIVNPEKTGKDAWNDTLIVNGIKLSVGQGGVRTINSPKSYYGNIVHYDVTSMFPTIMCNYNLFPRHMSDSFKELYKSIRKERIMAKFVENTKKADFLKNTLNAAIGLMNSDWSYMYDPAMNTAIRIQAMLTTLQLLDIILEKAEIIQVNVDGIFCLTKDDSVSIDVSRFSRNNGLNIKYNVFNEMHQYSVNDYIAVRKDANKKVVVRKGMFNYEQISKTITPSIVYEAIESNLVDNVPIKETIDNCKDVKKFLMSINIGNAFIVKHGNDVVPNAVRFAYTHSAQSYRLVRIKDGKESIIDKEGCTVVYDTSELDIKTINKFPYYGMANKIAMSFKQLKLF